MLLPYYQDKLMEVGCDEAGRGCLAGPVYAAAVILPKDFKNRELNDSKKLSRKQREALRLIVEKEAIGYAVASFDNLKIDQINILNASILAMHEALRQIREKFGLILVDGNRFKPFKKIPYQTIVQGDGIYMSIAAASILAKTYRDEFMEQAHHQYPVYNWHSNKGYGTETHRKAIMEHGYSPLHRRSFVLKEMQLRIL
ncbi:MAG: ribonuclease HII [Bacteroidetes bacterium]|nr:ribonuclease HII [Bacteroidota bacterium]